MIDRKPSEAEAYGREGMGIGLLAAAMTLVAHEFVPWFDSVYIVAVSMGIAGVLITYMGSREAVEVADEYVENEREQIRWTNDGPVLTLWDGTEVAVRSNHVDAEIILMEVEDGG